ncbi:MAG: DUF559 domain-containing protein [Solirubrobacteraceae bacterium]
MRSPTLDELVARLPLDPEDDESLNALHRAAMKAVVAQHVGFLSNDLEVALRRCASPIERVMLYAVWLAGYEYSDSVSTVAGGHRNGGNLSGGSGFDIEPQARVAGHRVDFLVRMWGESENGRRQVGMVVECDGHEWHERTREQAARDRRRDRDIQNAGYPVYRYAGSELWRDVFAAAEEVAQALSARLERARGPE